MLVESSETASIFDAHDLAGLQLGEHPVQHTGLGPTVNLISTIFQHSRSQ